MDLILQPLGALNWVMVVLIGTVILGIAIAYGMSRNRTRTPRERAVTDAGTRQVYEEQGRKP